MISHLCVQVCNKTQSQSQSLSRKIMDKNGCMMAAILNVQDGGQKVFDENGNGF